MQSLFYIIKWSLQVGEYDRKAIGKRIRMRRADLGLTAEALAKMVNVSRVTISAWERGTTVVSGDNLFTLSRTIQCSPEWLMTGEESVNVEQKPADLSVDEWRVVELIRKLPDSEITTVIEFINEKSIYYKKLYEELSKKYS